MNSEPGTRLMPSAPAAESAGPVSASDSRLVWEYAFAVLLFVGLIMFFVFKLGESVTRNIGLASAYAIIATAPSLVLALIERFCAPAGPQKSRKQWLLHLQINISYHIFLGIMTVYMVAVTTSAFENAGLNLGWIDLRVASAYGVIGLVAAFLISGLVYEFIFYWYHRWMHTVPILWQHHKMHHMDEQFDAMSAARQNWVEALFHTLLLTVPLAIFFKFDDLDPLRAGLVGGIVIAVIKGGRNINHSNLRMQFGWATVLFTSSQLHRIHHSRLTQHRDKNFTTTFPIWDIVFGTYYHPARDEFPPTGVDGEQEIRSYGEAQIFTLREWWKAYQGWRRRRTTASDSQSPLR
jgi:sterol desaturase/sphingolipid hydroxylase (fatty acid hydroxylase superfamily)